MARATVLQSACIGIIGLIIAFDAGAEPSRPEKVQAALDSWLAERASLEKVTGIAAYISLGDPGPAIEAFAGTIGRSPSDGPVSQDTLFQMGSTSKSFTAAVILKLEAAGTLSLDDTIGRWLSEYPAWQDVSIRRLLNMTSGIPNYSETEAMSRLWVEETQRDLSAEELVRLAYPTSSNKLPVTTGYHYSNTNYILASMIAEKASGKTFRDLVHELVIGPVGLYSTFYESGTYPAPVIRRLAHGHFENPACTDYQPKDCAASWNLPLVGRDVRAMSTSWAQAAGGAVANPRDVNRWMRAVFAGRVVPAKQQGEWLRMISTRTGQPLTGLATEDPRGFSLGLVQAILGPMGAHWFYEGETLGYRTLYVWFAQDDILITVQTNSQPANGMDRLHDAVIAIYEAVKPPASP
ncbi:serine hydrolase domain-containing protein [Microvirga arabica]|uniref:serine hydrolase domain-containing protein n=1 Tax=Microvirga arabica TaxID=1128671 RepID=UPI001939542B|nr:serine hydrolase domain-containing protein [Microvirga arabica]MBM1172683.1 beta-lactamase family protein [Microvirga arabica]